MKVMVMPTQLPTSAKAEEGFSYSYKPSLIGSACQFELTDGGVSWRVSGRSGTWRYEKIAAIRLSYRPMTMQSRRFRADICNVSGQSIPIISVSWQTAALVAAQDEPYRNFITQLHRRIADAGGKPVLSAGLKPAVYGLGLVAVGFVGIALVGLLIRAAMTGSYSGILFLVGFAALFGWQIGGFMKRNKPRYYTLDSVPNDLVP
jgi:hypothetical protein